MDLVVKTRHGAVRGSRIDGVTTFRGIPYAAPPVGANRLGAPSRPASWDGVRDALRFGPTAPQPPFRPPFDQILPNPQVPGEDCLNLNVWTPDLSRAGLPVMVWIHGGSFVNGSGAVATYDGSRFARDGVVCVTINYRLGVEGFAWLRGAPPNRGLLDQVAALEWVRDNIAVFGGDPDNVTIFGESAGAMSVASLLAMPRARSLFRRAIMQSGAGHHVSSVATAERIAAMLGEKLGVEPTRDAVAGVPRDALIAAQRDISLESFGASDRERWGDVVHNMMAWEPVADGEVLPVRPIDAIAAGSSAGIEVLTGTTSEEHRLFLVPTGVVDLVTDDLLRLGAAAYGLPPDGVDAYRAARPDASPGDLLCAVATDWFFRIPAVRLAEAIGSDGSAYMYEFTWRSPAVDGRMGACHALELPFVFDTLDSGADRVLTGPAPPQSIADAMHAAWVAFARTGDPGWPRYEPGRRATMRFGETCEVEDDPRSGERCLWDGIR